MFKIFSLSVIVLFFIAQIEGFAAECPTPPTAIDPALTVKIDFDKSTGLYTYRYSLANGKGARLPIDLFTLPIHFAPIKTLAPQYWNGSTFDENDAIHRFTWSTAFQSAFATPGSIKSEFTLTSDKSPGLMPFYASGDAASLETVTINGDDEAIPDCPGFYSGLPILESMVSGLTQGPVGDDRISVEIELKDAKGERACGAVSPYEDRGRIGVLVKGSKDLDVKEIDLTSLRFGIGKAPVVSSKLHENQLLLQFEIPKVGIECGRDRVLFLTGRMKEGKDLLGGAPVKTKNCEKLKRKPPTPSKSNKSPHPA